MAVRASDTMASVSLFVEMLRTRPLALFWAMAAMQAVPWTLVPWLFYSAPPGQLPEVLAIGNDFQFGTEFGPPLAFWLAEIVYRGLGLFGVYLLSQVCIVVIYWAVFQLGRTMVGDTHAVMAVLLMAGIAVFSVPTPDFGPAILAAAIWSLMLSHYWRAAGRQEWSYWLLLGIEAGLLLLTTYAGVILIGLLVLFMVATPVGRRRLDSVWPWVAGLVAVVLLFPYLTWLDLSGGPILPDLGTVLRNLRAWAQLPLLLAISHLGFVILIVLGRGIVIKSPGRPPEVMRATVEPGARAFVYFFALAPIVAMGLFALITHRADSFVVTPLVVLSGLAAIIAAGDRIRIEHQYLIGMMWAALMLLPPLLVVFAVLVVPWTLAADLKVGRPAADMGQFFGESFQRRTGKPLAIVSGDRTTAALVAFTAPSRPSLYIADAPVYAPYVTRSDIDDSGAVVVWPTTDTTGRPPPEIAQQFPDLVAEVPRAFARRYQGRMPLQRVGWGMIRPRGQVPDTPPAPQPPSAPLPLPTPPAEFPVQQPQARPQPQPQPQPPAQPAQQRQPQREPQRQFQQRPVQPQLHAPQ
jgi:outer membrane biosynthesis protein TonB